jgi:Tfp pilus assembly protein PilN
MVAAGVSWRADTTRQALMDPSKEMEETVALVAEKLALEDKIRALSVSRDRMYDAFLTELELNWPDIMTDIRDMIPESLYIQRIYNKSGSPIVYIDGISLTYGAVALFANKLNEAREITSAELAKAEQAIAGNKVVVSYQIKCITTAWEKMEKALLERRERIKNKMDGIEDEDVESAT